MAGTDWQEGTELNDGRPDRDYVGNYISVWVTDVAWMCSIKWGTTWGHITFAEPQSKPLRGAHPYSGYPATTSPTPERETVRS